MTAHQPTSSRLSQFPRTSESARRQFSRRQFILGSLFVGGAGALAACTGSGSGSAPAAGTGSASASALPGVPPAPDLGAPTVTKQLTATPMTFDFGGVKAQSWGYRAGQGTPAIEAKLGDVIRVELDNQLPDDTSIHWHGIALHNAADGVPGTTQQPIAPGQKYTYTFEAATAGTHFFHSHSGLQLDRGLHAPIIIRDPEDPEDQDLEWVVVLDDWLDGVQGTPEEALAKLTSGDGSGHMHGDAMGMGGDHSMHDIQGMHHQMQSMGDMGSMDFDSDAAEAQFLDSGADVGDVSYPLFLINGRAPKDPETFNAKPGQKVRIRFINASADTIFKTALGAHRLTVTHVDGHAVQPREIPNFFISPGERADVSVILGDGAFPLVAEALGKDNRAFALVKTSAGATPTPTSEVAELREAGALLHHFVPAERAKLPMGEPARTQEVALTGDMMNYNWGMQIDGSNQPSTVTEGERLRMRMTNHTMMPHPMHLHGHTWSMPGRGGLRKDTILVLPMQTVEADLIADNPGRWAFHCHNAYHLDVGMHTFLNYE